MRNCLLFIILIMGSLCTADYTFAEDNVITVYPNREIGEINNNVFGNNFLANIQRIAFKDRTEEYYGYSDYGAGIWNPETDEPVKEVIDLAREIGISVVRFATAGNLDNWKSAIGKKRKRYLYGVDEFLRTMEEIGAEPFFTINYFAGNEQDAADLVEYLNAPYDGKHPWADKRAENGHPDPYGVKYFELGNEVYNKKKVKPEDYAARYISYQKAMKNVDASIQLGLTLHLNSNLQWNPKVLEVAGSKVDFVVRHVHPPRDAGFNLPENIGANTLFRVVLGSTAVYSEKNLIDILELIKKKTGRDDIYFALNEHNGGFVQNKPVPYRHALGTALINAELLRIFMKPENKVLMAMNWHFSNSYFGMIKSAGDFMTHDYRKPINYIKRPNYYVYELYNRHFGDVLIGVDMKSDTFDISSYSPYMISFIRRTDMKYGTLVQQNLLNNKWKIGEFPGVVAEENGEVLKIDFKEPEKFNYFHSVKHAKVHPDTYYKLSGYIKTDGLVAKRGVSLEVADGRGWPKTHSSAATVKVAGTTDWKYATAIYKTLHDAESIDVIARRVGFKNEEPLRGKAFFKDVKFEKYTPSDMPVAYLSVNASKSKDGNKVYLMVINRNMEEAVTSHVEVKDFLPLKKAGSWVLNGPSVDSNNERKKDNVRVTQREFEIINKSFKFTFDPHSLTAIEIQRR